MIQIEDWVAIAIILAFFFLCTCYLVYFIISRKLFPKVAEFQKTIEPNKAATVLTIEGSGIIKKIEMQSTENSNSSIVMIVDRMSYTTFSIAKKASNMKKENLELNDNLLNLEVNLDAKFRKDFSLFIDNRSNEPINSVGKIFYEIKKLDS